MSRRILVMSKLEVTLHAHLLATRCAGAGRKSRAAAARCRAAAGRSGGRLGVAGCAVGTRAGHRGAGSGRRGGNRARVPLQAMAVTATAAAPPRAPLLSRSSRKRDTRCAPARGACCAGRLVCIADASDPATPSSPLLGATRAARAALARVGEKARAMLADPPPPVSYWSEALPPPGAGRARLTYEACFALPPDELWNRIAQWDGAHFPRAFPFQVVSVTGGDDAPATAGDMRVLCDAHGYRSLEVRDAGRVGLPTARCSRRDVLTALPPHACALTCNFPGPLAHRYTCAALTGPAELTYLRARSCCGPWTPLTAATSMALCRTALSRWRTSWSA